LGDRFGKVRLTRIEKERDWNVKKSEKREFKKEIGGSNTVYIWEVNRTYQNPWEEEVEENTGNKGAGHCLTVDPAATLMEASQCRGAGKGWKTNWGKESDKCPKIWGGKKRG